MVANCFAPRWPASIGIAPGIVFSAKADYRNYIRMSCGLPWSMTHRARHREAGEARQRDGRSREFMAHGLPDLSRTCSVRLEPGHLRLTHDSERYRTARSHRLRSPPVRMPATALLRHSVT